MKKTLLWLVVLLMALSPAAQALTFTDTDIEYPIFPWGEHTLQLSQYTDDASLIAYTPTPAEGTLVMVSLSSLSGAIPLEDVRASLAQFTLEDADKTVYVPIDCLVKGVSFKDSQPAAMADSQRGFDLVYFLPQGVATDGTALLVGSPDDQERPFIQIPTATADGAPQTTVAETTAENPDQATVEGTAEPTPEATDEPMSEAEPTPEATAVPEPFTVTVDGVAYSVYVEAAGFNEDGNFEVTIVLPDYGILDFLKNKKLAIPVGCGVVNGAKVSFTEGFSASVSDPLSVSYEYDTKNVTPPLLLIGRRENAKKSKDPFVIVETATLARLGEVTADQLKNGEEGVLAAAKGDTSTTAAETKATPAPTAPAATPRPASNANEGFLNDLMSMEAASAKDAWVRAILMAGASNVTYADGVLSFQLRSYVPNLKALGKDFTADALYQNLSQYNLPCTLKASEESGSLTAEPKAVSAMLKVIGKAAAQAKKEFANKAVLAVITARLSGDALTGGDAGLYAPLFASQNKLKFSIKEGPDALTYSAMYADTDTLLENSRVAALKRIAHTEGGNALSGDEVERIFREDLTAQAALLKKKASWNATFTFGIDALFATQNSNAGDAYATFLSRFAEAYASQLSTLKDDTAALPAYPAVDMPKTGWVTGSTSGTRVIMRIPKDGFARYVQMRGAETDALAVAAFIQPGKTATVRVPKGMYYLLIAVGDLWYGTEHLFGDTGDYIRTEQLEILGSNYYHTLTLGGAKNGNMSSYGSEPEAFQ